MADYDKSGSRWLGSRPLVHSGFYATWNCRALKQALLGHLQVCLILRMQQVLPVSWCLRWREQASSRL